MTNVLPWTKHPHILVSVEGKIYEKGSEKTYYNEKGHLAFQFVDEDTGELKQAYVHTAVVDTFIRLTDTSKHWIHHINENPLDNHKDNLLIVTPEEHFALHTTIQELTKEWWFRSYASCKSDYGTADEWNDPVVFKREVIDNFHGDHAGLSIQPINRELGLQPGNIALCDTVIPQSEGQPVKGGWVLQTKSAFYGGTGTKRFKSKEEADEWRNNMFKKRTIKL